MTPQRFEVEIFEMPSSQHSPVVAGYELAHGGRWSRTHPTKYCTINPAQRPILHSLEFDSICFSLSDSAMESLIKVKLSFNDGVLESIQFSEYLIDGYRFSVDICMNL